MFTSLVDIVKNKEMRNRILFTLFILFIFRLGAQIPAPNVDTETALDTSGLIGMINLLGGGALDKMSIFSLGIGPYITASIIIQLLSMDVIPHLTELAKMGQQGRKQLDKYTRYLSLILAVFQAYTMIMLLDKQYGVVINNDFAGYIYITVVFTAGTMFLLWLADRISLKGIGNGISMVIFAGIVADIPFEFSEAFKTLTTGVTSGSGLFNGILTFVGFILVYLLIILLVVFSQTAIRKIPIQYTSSTVSTKNREMTYLPLKINSASVIPVIFASAVMIAPVTIVQLLINNDIITSGDWVTTMNNFLNMESALSLVIYVILIILFTFFYTKLIIDPEKIAESLQKSGTYIPGIRPGKETKEYINRVLCRITVLGSIVLAFVAVLPHVAPLVITSLPSSIRMGGTGMIIVVGVAMETVAQIEGKMTAKSYRGFMGIGR